MVHASKGACFLCLNIINMITELGINTDTEYKLSYNKIVV